MIRTTVGEEKEKEIKLMPNHKPIFTNLQVTHRRESGQDGEEKGASRQEKKATENPSREDGRQMPKLRAKAKGHYRSTSHRRSNCIYQTWTTSPRLAAQPNIS